MKRAVIFAHYDKEGLVDDYVIYYLQALKQVSDYLICVSTAPLLPKEKEKLAALCDHLIVRENEGYDFMSYKVGLQSIDYQDYDQLLLCNDSVYGPLFDLLSIFGQMDQHPCDFWGMTESREIRYHLQSYFILFKTKALHSDAFRAFWDDIEILQDKDEIIRRYETGLTATLQQAGLQAAAFAVPTPSSFQKAVLFIRKLTPGRIIKKVRQIVSGRHTALPSVQHVNVTLTFWEELLLRTRMPFIKIALLRDNPNRVPIDHIYEVISSCSEYAVEMIKAHQKRISKRT